MIKIKTYYIKTGKSKLFKKININENYCEILKKIDNDKNIKKVISEMQKNDIKYLILETKLSDNKEFIKNLKNIGMKIFDGQWLYKYIVPDIVDYIYLKDKELSNNDNVEIAILSNDLSEVLVGNLEILSSKFKKLKIVTEHPERFVKLDRKTLENSGFSIIITQNKKLALSRTKIIVNIDFSEEIINQYNICNNAIIINLKENLTIRKKRFEGIIINDYDVLTKKENYDYDFKIKDIIESEIFEKLLEEKKLEEINISNFSKVRKKIEEDGIKIKELYSKNGCVL